MALLNEELYEALKSANADDEKARSAARAIGSIKTDLLLIKWMVGVNTGGLLLVIGLIIYLIKTT